MVHLAISGLMVDDGETRIFDQNDSRPIDLEVLNSYGPYDAHFLQFSGAIWYPMVYRFPEKMLQALGRKKRENEMARALRYTREIGASFVIPSAGPPCFLDDHLYQFNDFDRDPANTFPDQTVFLEYMRENGLDNGRLMLPGTVATLTREACTVEHPYPMEQVQAIFSQKRAYLDSYKARQQPIIDAQKASWPRGQVDILQSIHDWFEPLLEQADLTSVGINGRVVIDCDVQHIVLDFHTRRVYAWDSDRNGIIAFTSTRRFSNIASFITKRTGSTRFSSPAVSRQSAKVHITSMSTTSSNVSHQSACNMLKGTMLRRQQ